MQLLGICPKNSTSYSTDPWSAMFVTAPSAAVRQWKQSKYPLANEWIVKYGTCILWNTLQQEKKVKS